MTDAADAMISNFAERLLDVLRKTGAIAKTIIKPGQKVASGAIAEVT